MNTQKAKRNEMVFELLRTFVAIGIALVIVVIVIMFVSDEPAKAMKALFLGPLSNKRRIGNVIELAIPLTFCGLAIAITFRAKQFNLIADSAFYAGGFVSFIIALKLNAPTPLVILLALVGGTVIGAFLGSIPAIMKLKLGAMELVSSLMLNYIVGFIILYFLTDKVRDPNSMELRSVSLPKGLNLGTLIPGTRIHYGLIIAILCVVIASVFLFKNKRGYELRMTGSNQNFALFSGIAVSQTIVGAQVLGASIAGLGGAVEMLGIYDNFKWSKSPGYGFDGIIIATLARNNPALVPFAALFLAYLRNGADILNRTVDVPYEIVSVIQATIILLIAAKAFLGQLKQRALVKQTISVAQK